MECELKTHEFLELCDKQELNVQGAHIELFEVSKKIINEDKNFAATLITRILNGDLLATEDARLFAKAITNEMISTQLSVN